MLIFFIVQFQLWKVEKKKNKEEWEMKERIIIKQNAVLLYSLFQFEVSVSKIITHANKFVIFEQLHYALQVGPLFTFPFLFIAKAMKL